MPVRPATKNNVIAGVFLIGCLVMAVVMSVVISGAAERLTPTHRYTVLFSLSEGAQGLKKGSPVNFGGQKVGRVAEVEVQRDDAGAPTAIRVNIRIRAALRLHEDALVFLEKPLLGSLSSLNFTSAGMGEVLPEGGTLDGMIAPPSFLAQAGYGPEQAEKVRKIIDEVEAMTSKVAGMIDRIDPEIDPNVKALSEAIENVRSVTADVKESLPGWTSSVDTVLADAEAASAEFGPITQSAKEGVEEARQVVRSVQSAVDDNRPKFDSIVDNVESTTAKIDHEMAPKATQLLDDAAIGVEEFSEIGIETNALLREQAPNIRKILANFRLASDQFKIAVGEIKREPWRLLYRPKTKELSEQLLYDSTRVYAEAVSDLRAASESLESAAAGASPQALDRQTVEDLRAQFQEAFERYQKAEQDLLKRLGEHPGK